MIAIVPDPWMPGSVVVGSGDDDGVTTDISVESRPHGGKPPFTVRTMVRTGMRMGPGDHVYGVATDWVGMASMAATGLLLQTIPPGLPRVDGHREAHAALAEADRLAGDHAGWSYTPMVLDGVTYALRFRMLEQGFVAHADIGDCVLAAWGTGDLPPELSYVRRLDSDTVPRPD